MIFKLLDFPHLTLIYTLDIHAISKFTNLHFSDAFGGGGSGQFRNLCCWIQLTRFHLRYIKIPLEHIKLSLHALIEYQIMFVRFSGFSACDKIAWKLVVLVTYINVCPWTLRMIYVLALFA